MNHDDFDANGHLEVLPDDDAGGFLVFLFDYAIGDGDTVEAALNEAKKNIRRWKEDLQ